MEYAIGSLVTIATICIVIFFIRKRPPQQISEIRYSQSHIYNLIAAFMPDNDEMQPMPVTQSTKHYGAISTRVVFMDRKAYWISDNTFYVADAQGKEIITETATPVDTMSMDRVQLDKIKFVVEKLTEGNTNDSWNAG